MTYREQLTSTDELVSRMQERHGTKGLILTKQAPPVTQLQSEVELFERIIDAKSEVHRAQYRHDEVNQERYREGFLTSTYEPLSAKQRMKQEGLFREYKGRKASYKRLRNSLTPVQSLAYEDYKQDTESYESAGNLLEAGVVFLLFINIFAFSIAATNLLFAVLPLLYGHHTSFTPTIVSWAVFITLLILLVHVARSAVRERAKARALYKAKWYPNSELPANL